MLHWSLRKWKEIILCNYLKYTCISASNWADILHWEIPFALRSSDTKRDLFLFFLMRSKRWLAGCSELAQQSQKYITRVSMCAWHLRNSAKGFCMTPPSQHKISISETYMQTHLLHPLHMCRGLKLNSCCSTYCTFKHTAEQSLIACTAAEQLCCRILLPSSSPTEDSSVTLQKLLQEPVGFSAPRWSGARTVWVHGSLFW